MCSIDEKNFASLQYLIHREIKTISSNSPALSFPRLLDERSKDPPVRGQYQSEVKINIHRYQLHDVHNTEYFFQYSASSC